MGRSLFFLAGAAFFLLCRLAPHAMAYTPTVAPNGVAVKWSGKPKFNLAGNPTNRSGFDANQFRASVVRGLQRWQVASGGSVSFDYWQGTDPSVYPPNSEYNGLSSVYFASAQESMSGALSPNVLGLTQVWYNTDTGEVLEADIVLNDRDFRFTTNPADTSGYGTGNTGLSGGRNKVFIDNVLTHEIGHALGLSHAGGLQSTMLFMESPEQAYLGCDDHTAIRALYPAADSGARGSVSGVVTGPNGSPVFGAHVLAISRRRGAIIATALSDKSGRYAIGALEPGDYFIAVEPFLAGAQVLPAYYGAMDALLCPGNSSFSRSFLTDAGGFRLMAVRVEPQRQTVAPTLSVRCVLGGGAAVTSQESGQESAASSGGVPVIYQGTGGAGGFGVVDRFNTGMSLYLLSGVSGRLELRALSYTLYSPVRPLLSLFDDLGREVSAQVTDRVYVGESGFTNYDAALIADGLLPGDYYLQVEGRLMNASLYPAGPVMLDTVPFLILSGSVNEPGPALSQALPFNARCRMSEAFPAYRSPPGNPPRRSTSGSEGGVGFCGNIQLRNGGDSGESGPGPGAGAIAGWFIPWAFMLATLQLFRLSFRRRSQLARP